MGSLAGLIVLDEIQTRADLFPVLRVLADRPAANARFLILGSAAPELMQRSAESLAGRIEYVDLHGFDLRETDPGSTGRLWLRGGFPRPYLAPSNADSVAWREGFVRTFLERDLPQFGIRVSAAAMRRFWTMLAHGHGQLWNASAVGRSMGLSDKTVRAYLDELSQTFMGTSASVCRVGPIMRNSSRGRSGWMRSDRGGAEELPIHAQGRIFLVGSSPP